MTSDAPYEPQSPDEAINNLPGDLQRPARELLQNTDFETSATVEQFGAGTLKAAEAVSQEFSQLTLSFEGAKANQVLAKARGLIALVNPLILTQSIIARVIYAIKTLGVPNRLSELARDFDDVAVDLTRQDEALKSLPGRFAQLASELEVGAAVLTAASAKIQHKQQSLNTSDLVWIEGQRDRMALRHDMFLNLAATLRHQAATVTSTRSVLSQLLTLVDGFSHQILPEWRSEARSYTGVNVLFGGQGGMPTRQQAMISEITSKLDTINEVVCQAEQHSRSSR